MASSRDSWYTANSSRNWSAVLKQSYILFNPGIKAARVHSRHTASHNSDFILQLHIVISFLCYPIFSIERFQSLSLLEAKHLHGNNFLQAQDDISPGTKMARTDYIKTKIVKMIKISKKIMVYASKHDYYFSSLTKFHLGCIYFMTCTHCKIHEHENTTSAGTKAWWGL